MAKPLSQRSHSQAKPSKGWAGGSMPYGKASKSARRYMEGERVLNEAREDAGLPPEASGEDGEDDG